MFGRIARLLTQRTDAISLSFGFIANCSVIQGIDREKPSCLAQRNILPMIDFQQIVGYH